MKRQGGWWMVGVTAALLTPALAPRPAAAGPFDYVKKTDDVRNQAPQNPPPRQNPPPQQQAPVRSVHPMPAREPQSPVVRSNPFGYVPPQRGNFPQAPVTPNGPYTRATPPTYRPTPFGTVQPIAPPFNLVPPRVASPPDPGTFPPAVDRDPGAFPRGRGYQQPYGGRGSGQPYGGRGYQPPYGGRGYQPPDGGVHSQPQTRPAVPPVPRGGRGTLGSYFSREAREHQEEEEEEREHHPRRGGYPYYVYPPAYYYVSPYDLYPPEYYYYPEPYPVYVPTPEVEVVPVPEAGAGGEIEGVTLDDLIGDIQEAWESGKLDLLMRHVRPDVKVEVYRGGQWVDSLSQAEFGQKTEQAFRDYDTVSMTFEKPELVGRDETGAPGARARATHIYKTRDGEEHRVRVTYALRKYGRSWYVVGLDYEPTARQNAAAPGTAPAPTTLTSAAPPVRWAAPVAAGQLRLVSAPPVRVRDLLNAHQPRPLATVKWLHHGGRTFYTLEAMRGVAPETVAWALYRKGEKRPIETGAVDVSALPAPGWAAVRPQGPQLVTLASRAPARRRLALLATGAFPDTSLALVPAKPPVKAGRSAMPGHKGRHFRSKAHRA